MNEKIVLKSDCRFLENAFAWAQNKTSQFVVTGIKKGPINKGDGGKWYGPNGKISNSPDFDWAQPKDYVPSFWAGYFDRTAFYIRDFVHQAIGAHLAGLDDEIYSMYKICIDSACKETAGYTLWSFNFDGSVYYMDTPNYSSFVRELTAQFELAETAYTMYLWTGDRRYIDDDRIFAFIKNLMTDFIDNHDGTVLPFKNGIPEGKGDIWQGSSTYNERGFHAAEAGDCIGSMYQAMLAYSKILALRGDARESSKQLARAKKLKDYFNNDWSVTGSVTDGSDAYCYAIDSKGKKHYKWYKNGSEIHGGASMFFMPMKEITAAGARTDKLLDYIHNCEKDEKLCEDNLESYTYLPQVFFAYNQNNRAWHWMKYIINRKDLPHERKTQGTNGDYPEISFTFLQHTVSGLMGVSPNVFDKAVEIIPRLPDEIGYISADNIPTGDIKTDVCVKSNEIIFKNNSDEEIKLTAGFCKKADTLTVNGKTVTAQSKVKNGVQISYAVISVQKNEMVIIGSI